MQWNDAYTILQHEGFAVLDLNTNRDTKAQTPCSPEVLRDT